MKRYLYLAIAIGCLANKQAAAQAGSSNPPAKPVVRLSRPEHNPLRGQALIEAFKGQRLYIDVDIFKNENIKVEALYLGGCAPVEAFHADGRWERAICAIQVQKKVGTWRVNDNQICVNTGLAQECRQAWRMKLQKHYVLSIDGLVAPIAGTLGAYNPYRTEPLANGS